jgi:hypothetical protein
MFVCVRVQLIGPFIEPIMSLMSDAGEGSAEPGICTKNIASIDKVDSNAACAGRLDGKIERSGMSWGNIRIQIIRKGEDEDACGWEMFFTFDRHCAASIFLGGLCYFPCTHPQWNKNWFKPILDGRQYFGGAATCW